MPDFSSTKIPEYCTRILTILWDEKKVVKALKNATALIDSVTAGKTVTRDDIRLPKFKKEILEALTSKRLKLLKK